MNKVFIIGFLGKDPEVKTINSGKTVTTFSVGVSDGFGDKKQTSWFNCVAWEKLAEMVGNNLSKGSKVMVEGKLSTRSYENKEGKKVYVTEIVAQSVEFLSPKAEAKTGADAFGSDVPVEAPPF